MWNSINRPKSIPSQARADGLDSGDMRGERSWHMGLRPDPSFPSRPTRWAAAPFHPTHPAAHCWCLIF